MNIVNDRWETEATAVLRYALGLTDQRPQTVELGIDPGRVSGFVTRFLDERGLMVRRKQVDTPRSINGRGRNERSNSMRAALLDRPEQETTEFVTTAKRAAKEQKIPVHQAMSNLSLERPDLYAQHSRRTGRRGHAMDPVAKAVSDAMLSFIGLAKLATKKDGGTLASAMSRLAARDPRSYEKFAATVPRRKREPESEARFFARLC